MLTKLLGTHPLNRSLRYSQSQRQTRQIEEYMEGTANIEQRNASTKTNEATKEKETHFSAVGQYNQLVRNVQSSEF